MKNPLAVVKVAVQKNAHFMYTYFERTIIHHGYWDNHIKCGKQENNLGLYFLFNFVQLFN